MLDYRSCCIGTARENPRFQPRGPCGCFSSWAAGGGSERESSRQQAPGPHGIALQILSLSTWDLQFQRLQHQQQSQLIRYLCFTLHQMKFDYSSCQTDNITSYKKEIYIICVKVMCDNGLLTLAAGFPAAMPRNLLSLHAIQGIIMVQFPPPLKKKLFAPRSLAS